MIAYLILALSALGCGALFPAPAGDSRNAIGIRFMAGVSVLILILFFGNVVLRVPLGTTAFAVLAIAAIGLVRLGLEIRAGRFSRACLLHPVPILLLMIGIVILARGGVDYLPWQWDEYSRWLYFAKLASFTEMYWTESFRKSNQGYTPGWTTLMVYPSLILGRFSAANAATLPFVMHVGFLGILYDVARSDLRRIEFVSFGTRLAAAWLVVLLLLLAEASWKLVPTLLTTEKPQIYLLGACLATVLHVADKPTARTTLAAYCGLFIAAGYILKTAFLALIPSLVFFAAFLLFRNDALEGPIRQRWKWRNAHAGRRLLALCLLFLPLFSGFVAWNLISTSKSCYGAPIELFSVGKFAILFSDFAAKMANRYVAETITYLAHYKVPLTIVGAIGVLAGLAHRRTALLSVMLGLFIGVYVLALYYFHLTCFSYYYDLETLNSIPRFTRVWLRLVHVFGPLLLFLMVVEWISRSRGPLWRLGKSRGVAFAATGFAMLLFAWQAVQAASSFDAMATRADFRLKDGGRHYRIVRDIPAEATALKALLKQNGLIDPKVLLIVQGGTGFAVLVAKYHAAAVSRTMPMYAYRLAWPASWGETKVTRFMQKTTVEGMLTILRRHRVIWPFILDDWMRDSLAKLTDDPACRARPGRYFLLRRGKEGTPYTCVAKWPEKTPTD